MPRNRSLTALVAARLVSFAGTSMTAVALPWFVLATTGSVTRMGIVLACQWLPGLLLGIPGGSAVAFLGARRALIVADTARIPLIAALPILAATGGLTFGLVVTIAFAVGAFGVPYAAAAGAVLPEVVGDDERELTHAQATLQVAIQTSGIVGPLVAGVLIPVIGAAHVLYIDAASYAVSAVLLAGFVRAGDTSARTGARRGALAGIRHVLADRVLGSVVLAGLFGHLSLAGLTSSIPALAFRHFHDAHVAGILLTSDAIGSVLGGLVAVRLARRVDPIRLGIVGYAAMSAPLWLLTGWTPRSLAIGVMFVFGLGGPLAVAPTGAILTRRAPAAIRAQVIAAFYSVSTAGMPLGALLTGFVVPRLGFGAAYAGIAAAMTVATLLFARCTRRAKTGAELGALIAVPPRLSRTSPPSGGRTDLAVREN